MHPRRDSQKTPRESAEPINKLDGHQQCPVLRKTQREVCRQPQRGFPPQGWKSLMSPQASTDGLLGGSFSARCPGWRGKRSPERMSGGDSGGGKAAGKVPPCQSNGFLLLELSAICSLAPLSRISSMGYTSGFAHQVIKNIHLKITKTSKLEIIQTSSLKTALKQPTTATEKL